MRRGPGWAVALMALAAMACGSEGPMDPGGPAGEPDPPCEPGVSPAQITCACPSGAWGWSSCDPVARVYRACDRCGSVPSCSARYCGPDGFGNSCGSCGAGRRCTPQGHCE